MHNIPVIYYHSVAPEKNPGWFRGYLTLELKYFEEHLKYFKRNGYELIFVKDLIKPDIKKSKKKLAAISFDDGYLDNYIYVFPLLKKYNVKATVFVNPSYVDKRDIIRDTLEDYWYGKRSLMEINKWGFLSWEEMRIMEESSLVDIQSHTLTHNKYVVSDKLTGFHHPGNDCLYRAAENYPERLPYYIGDQEFEQLVPYGYPLFEERSSVIARKVKISRTFIDSVISSFKDYDWIHSPPPDPQKFNVPSEIIESVESEEEYVKRLEYELSESKKIIEEKLSKTVDICCWPHGDSNEFTHRTAINLGYKATTTGNNGSLTDDTARIPQRIGLTHSKNSILLTRLKMHYKVRSLEQEQPFYLIDKIYNKIRYGINK
jgi:peptidoglycan/xylan/chitin deacetylase (PgdA/CDA1 family)